MKTIFVVLLHGNEQTPLKVIKKYFDGELKYIIAHPEAFKKNIRYLETDLNRSFPGKINGSKEERIAIGLMKKLKNYQQAIIDLHTANCDTPPFVILTKITQEHLKLVSLLGLKRVVYMEKSIASGRALIDHFPIAISVECGKEAAPVTFRSIKKMFDNFLNKRSISLKKVEYYSVFKILNKQTDKERLVEKIKSFKLVRKGEVISRIGKKVRRASVDFYPVLPREKSYKNVLCLMARKISLDYLKKLFNRGLVSS